MVTVKLIRNTYGGEDYLAHLCPYVRNGEKAVYLEGNGVSPYHADAAYDQMMAVKRYFGKTSGNPLAHFVVSFDDRSPPIIRLSIS